MKMRMKLRMRRNDADEDDAAEKYVGVGAVLALSCLSVADQADIDYGICLSKL